MLLKHSCQILEGHIWRQLSQLFVPNLFGLAQNLSLVYCQGECVLVFGTANTAGRANCEQATSAVRICRSTEKRNATMGSELSIYYKDMQKKCLSSRREE